MTSCGARLQGGASHQYGATLLRWWGLDEAQVDSVFPNLANFGSARSLGFLA